AALCGLVGPRPGFALPHGAGLRADARRRRLATEQPADPRPGTLARLAATVRARGRDAGAARALGAPYRLPRGVDRATPGRHAAGGYAARTLSPWRATLVARGRWPRAWARPVRVPGTQRHRRRLARTRRDPDLARAAVQQPRRHPALRARGRGLAHRERMGPGPRLTIVGAALR